MEAEKTKVWNTRKWKKLRKLGHYQKERGLETQFWLLYTLFDFEKCECFSRVSKQRDTSEKTLSNERFVKKRRSKWNFMGLCTCAKYCLHCQGELSMKLGQVNIQISSETETSFSADFAMACETWTNPERTFCCFSPAQSHKEHIN